MVDIDNSDYSAYMTFFKTVLIWTSIFIFYQSPVQIQSRIWRGGVWGGSTSYQQRSAIHWCLSSAPNEKDLSFLKPRCASCSPTCAPELWMCRQFGTEICVLCWEFQ